VTATYTISGSLADSGKPHSVPTQRGVDAVVPRLCAGCGVPLSRYNQQSVCGACAHSARGVDNSGDSTDTPELAISGRLATYRRQASLTQQQLADRCGLSTDLIKKLEQGARTSARLANIVALAGGLRVSVSALLEPTESPGHLVRAARRRRGWSQSMLADRAGLSIAYLSLIENGKRPLASLRTIRRLATALHVSPAQLVPWLNGGHSSADGGCPRCGAGTSDGDIDQRVATTSE
jgi:transcriptional regulator with XRE-family HTH domain